MITDIDISPSHLTEGCILTWAEIAKISEGEDLNVALIKLVSYLTSNHDFFSALAYHEVSKLSLTVTRKKIDCFYS